MKSIIYHCAIVCAVAGLVFILDQGQAKAASVPAKGAERTETSNVTATKPVVVSNNKAQSREQAEPLPEETVYYDRKPRPFQVAKTSEGFEWTAENGLDPSVTKELSLNSEMEKALTDEGLFTYRRQLIYPPAGFADTARQVLGGDLEEVTLPGFDGETFKVLIDDTHTIDLDQVSGSFTGTIEGATESLVVAASDKDHWSIGIDVDGQHYQIQNRGHGEWILSDLDVAGLTHAAGACGAADARTTDSVGSPITN